MSEITLYSDLLIGFLLTGAVIFPLLFFIDAPYGRYIGKPWQGPTINNLLGWMVMEAPAALVFAICFIAGAYHHTLIAWLFLGLWETHYVHRAFIYPLGLRGQNKRMPILTATMAYCFNVVNGYLNGRYLFTFSGGYLNEWLGDPRVILGTGFFAVGYIVNRHADYVLQTLRAPDESGYKIPHGWLYRWISSPNYLGEIIE